jgi:hypothetical protein
MSDHEHTEPQPDERVEEVEDLEVPEGQQENVAGGIDSETSDSKHKDHIIVERR